MDRLTIDVNVARDFLDPHRDGHALAKKLFALNGDSVELAVAAQGQRLDVQSGSLRRQLAGLRAWEDISETRQLAYPSEETYPSEDLFPGQVVEGFQEAWGAVIKDWRTSDGKAPQHPDDMHAEAHVLDERDYFLTSDRGLLVMCQRLRDEHEIPIHASTVSDYLAHRHLRELDDAASEQ